MSHLSDTVARIKPLGDYFHSLTLMLSI
jgi:hypothetical protein